MTHAHESPVTRETFATHRRRPLVVTVMAHLFIIREKGRRDRVECPIDAAYDLGLKLRARAKREEKATRKKAGVK